jgi:hypothetical protein
MAKKDSALQEKQQKLIELTSAFCDKHLDAEYKQLCTKLIGKMGRKRQVPFTTGKLENWAAGVVHALGTINFLFDPDSEPNVRSSDIASYFGTAQSTMSQKSKAIRDMFKMRPGPLGSGAGEFATEHMKEQWAPMEEMMQQMADTLMLQQIQQGIESGELTVVEVEEDEFVDVSRPAMDRYYSLCERYSDQGASKALQRGLEKLIEQDPDFLDSYATLSSVLRSQGQEEEADRLIQEAYQRALRLVTDDEGNWPGLLEWGWLENRHIIRALLNEAILLWKSNKNDAALDLFRKLLRSNPQDNAGARNYILAIRQGMSFDDFESRFNKGGFYDADMLDWFEENFERFPDEFDWWKEAVEWEE